MGENQKPNPKRQLKREAVSSGCLSNMAFLFLFFFFPHTTQQQQRQSPLSPTNSFLTKFLHNVGGFHSQLLVLLLHGVLGYMVVWGSRNWHEIVKIFLFLFSFFWWVMVMGSRRRWVCSVWVMFCLSALVFVEGLNEYDPESLDVFILHQAWKALGRPYTGRVYRVHLPANFSTMEVSVVRLRSGSLWARGVNFSSFHIPPGTFPIPHVKRLAMVYENLGNWSSDYYKVPGFSLVSPVVGFMAYDATNLSALGNLKINFSILKVPISVHFPGILFPKKEHDIKCVTFGDDGSVQFSNMTTPNVCFAQGQGHFSVVVPAPPERKQRWWKWWAVGFGGSFASLVMVVVAVLAIVKVVKKKKLEELEGKSETSEALNTIWIGRSKVPSAAMIRTQPALENSYVP